MSFNASSFDMQGIHFDIFLCETSDDGSDKKHQFFGGVWEEHQILI